MSLYMRALGASRQGRISLATLAAIGQQSHELVGCFFDVAVFLGVSQ